MAVGIIEIFEVIYIHDRHSVRFFEVEHGIIEGPARRQCCQLIMVGEKIRVFDDRTQQNQTCGCPIRSTCWSDAPHVDRHQRC